MNKDTFVDEQKKATQEEKILDPLSDGLLTLHLNEEVITYLGKIFKEIFEKNKSSRNGLTMLKGAIFSIGTRKQNNPEWREHCAGSLRELVHECRGIGKISKWFCNTFKEKHSNFPNSSKARDEYARIDGFYKYFSEIHHHNAVYIIQRLQFLYGGEVKVGDDNDEMFLQAVKDYIELLFKFFRKNIKEL